MANKDTSNNYSLPLILLIFVIVAAGVYGLSQFPTHNSFVASEQEKSAGPELLPDASNASDDDISMTTLRVIDQTIPFDEQYDGLMVAIEGTGKVTLDAEKEKIANLRQWAATVSDSKIRNSYVHWLNYLDQRLNEAYEELRTHAIRKDMDDYRAKLESQSSRVDELKKIIPQPPQ